MTNRAAGSRPGLIVGLALALRYIAGGAFELGEAAPWDPGILMGVGLFISSATAVYGVIAGGAALQSTILKATVPVLGDLKFVTSSIFDIGVYLIVIGLVLDVLRSMGAELDRQGVIDRSIWTSPQLRATRRSAGEPVTTNLRAGHHHRGLFASGVYLMLSRNLIRVILGFLLAGHGVNLLLLSTGSYGSPPIVGEATDGEQLADPIPQALILTSIVISLAVSTFLLAMAYRNYTSPGIRRLDDDPEDDDEFADADAGAGDE